MPTRQVYLEELDKLNNDVIRMGSILEQSINNMVLALKKMDARLAEEIIASDDKIDDCERNIERACISLIAKQQPVASDLRKVTSIMRIIADVERIADHCSDISEYIIRLSAEDEVAMPKYLIEMVYAMKEMVVDTIDSFVNSDVEKAKKVIAADDVVDDYFEKILEELCIAMKHNSDDIHQYAEYLLIVKYLERMADHATNIAGWITFIVTGALGL